MVDIAQTARISGGVVITGAAGLLGNQFAVSVGEAGGIPILIDNDLVKLNALSKQLETKAINHLTIICDVTIEIDVIAACKKAIDELGTITGLVNNVAYNPPLSQSKGNNGKLETFSLDQWNKEISVGLTSAFLFSKHIGPHMAHNGFGSIVNISSDLGIISPDQRIYTFDNDDSDTWPKKPVTYSVIKSAMIGLTRYLSTYWAPIPVRCNALAPGSVEGTQSPGLKDQLEYRIPLNRLARANEYNSALIFLLSEESSYMTGNCLVMDGGRSIW